MEIITKNGIGKPKSSADEGLVDDVLLSSVEVQTTEGGSPDGDMLDDTGKTTQQKQEKQQFEDDEREPLGERVSSNGAKVLLFISLPAHTPLSTLFH